MSLFGITQIHVNPSGEVDEVLLVKPHPDTSEPGRLGVTDGIVTPIEDVANLIALDDEVRVMIMDGPGRYRPGDRVRRRPYSQIECLESYDADGQRSEQLMQLPKW